MVRIASSVMVWIVFRTVVEFMVVVEIMGAVSIGITSSVVGESVDEIMVVVMVGVTVSIEIWITGGVGVISTEKRYKGRNTNV